MCTPRASVTHESGIACLYEKCMNKCGGHNTNCRDFRRARLTLSKGLQPLPGLFCNSLMAYKFWAAATAARKYAPSAVPPAKARPHISLIRFLCPTVGFGIRRGANRRRGLGMLTIRFLGKPSHLPLTNVSSLLMFVGFSCRLLYSSLRLSD